MNPKPPSAPRSKPFAVGTLQKAHVRRVEHSLNDWLGLRRIKQALALVGLALTAFGAVANNLGENSVWQFGSTQDKVNKATALDQVEKKKAGYYDAIRPVYKSLSEILCVRHTIPSKEFHASQNQQARYQRQIGTAANFSSAT